MAKRRAKCAKCGQYLEIGPEAGDRIVCEHCGTVLATPGSSRAGEADPLLGQMLGQFEIVGVLGRGGMGAVYKARQTSLDRFVALKILPRAFARDASFVERFAREARAAAAVKHPHIIGVYDVGQEGGLHFIAMELVQGQSLSDVLKQAGPLSPERAVDLLRQVASALGEAHDAGIHHRDIKPSNILLDHRGNAKVADFGLAKRQGMDVSVTQTGQALGTPLYMPPEAARGQPLDARSDLYSLGATFYQALAGRPPFQGSSAAELVGKHLEAKVPPLQQVAPDTPPALCRIIHRLLRKQPAQRYESAHQLLAALERLEGRLTAEPDDVTRTLPSAPRPATQPREPVARKKPVALMAGIGGGAVLLLLLLLLSPGGGRRPPKAVAPPPPSKAAPQSTPDTDEKNAAIVLNNARTCAAKGEWDKVETYLDRLQAKYGETKLHAASLATIADLRKQADAGLNPKPKPPEPKLPKPATDVATTPLPPPDAEGWTPLFDGKTLGGWARIEEGQYAGYKKIAVENGEIVLEAAEDNRFVGIRRDPLDLPATDYEVEVEAKRVAGDGDFCSITFPVGRSFCSLIVGGFDGTVVGFDEIDGTRIRDHSSVRHVTFEQGRWYRVRVRVTLARLEAWIDDKQVADLATAGHGLSLSQWSAPAKPLGIHAWQVSAAIRTIRWRRHKPKTDPKPPEPGVATAAWKIYTAWPFDAEEAKRRQAETAKALGVPVEQEIEVGDGVKLSLVLIPAGEFVMGTAQETKGFSRKKPEHPQHRVRLTRPFWLGKFEVTQEQWLVLVGRNPQGYPCGRNRLPARFVTWHNCREWFKRLGKRHAGREFRFPTEAEWEYACRAGAATVYPFGDDGSTLGEYASSSSPGDQHPVGGKRPNAWGLHDMLGSVQEWCHDRYSDYDAGDQTDPTGPAQGGSRIRRVGSRPAHREELAETSADNRLGFRTALSVQAQGRPEAVANAAPPPPPPPPLGVEQSDAVWALLGKREYAEANALLAKLAADPKLKDTPGLVADRQAAKLLAEFWAIVEKKLAQMKGRFTRVGEAAGQVVGVADGVVTLKTAKGPVQSPVRDLTAKQAVGFASLGDDPHERLLLGVFLLAEGDDPKEADAALAAAGDDPAITHYRKRLAPALARLAEAEPPAVPEPGPTTPEPKPSRPTWQPLFNGKDLAGWTGDTQGWTVERGTLAARGGSKGYLWARDDYGDFVLELEFRLPKDGNSGVFIRTANPGDPVKTGFEVQLIDGPHQKLDSKSSCGAIYGCLAPSRDAARQAGEWSQLTLACKGSRIAVELNGRRVVDMDLDRWTQPGRNPDGSPNGFAAALKDLPRAGRVGLQAWGTPAWFRNIRIRELPPEEPTQEKWQSLFDGKSLRGWSGNPKLWGVRNGVLVGKSPGGLPRHEFLATKQSAGDFVLHVEARLVGGRGNSGVMFRSEPRPGNTLVGYQLDIVPTAGTVANWGGLFDEGRSNRYLARANPADVAKVVRPADWNTYEIKAVGDAITLSINGAVVVQYTEPDPKTRRSGVVGLQLHKQDPVEVHFRNLRIQPLD